MAETDNTAPHRCPEHRFVELEKRVTKFNRRAAKLGTDPITVEIVGEEVVPILDEQFRPTGRVNIFILFEVHGEAPVVAGHTFVARVEHTEAGNIISKAPGCESIIVPAYMRDGAPTCDHCKTNRRRKDTFILKDENGILIRVGRNCLADFLRSSDAVEALRVWTLLYEIRIACAEESEGGWGGGGVVYASVIHYVACAVRAIALHGWTSRKMAYEHDEMSSTSDDASFAAGQIPTMCPREREAWKEAQPTKDNVEEAIKAVEWAKGLEGSNDYEHNLKVACSLEYVKPKNYGLVASVVMGYRRTVERELAKKRAAERAAASPSTHFGAVKSRYIRELTVTHSKSWENEYGVTVLYVMEDDGGNQFKWFSSNGCWFEDGDERRELKVGDKFWFTFAVKNHDEFNGIAETVIQRAARSDSKPTHKWVNEAGEVFKTKKAMKAAEEA